MRISAAIALGLLLGASRCESTSAGEPLPAAGPAANYQDPYAGNYGFGDGAPYGSDGPCSTGCSASCPHCGNSGCALDRLFWHGLPNPHRSTCDMPQHYMYYAEPKFYYYFRPYNWFHIPVQQDDVRAFGGDPRHPYDNRIFKSVYEQLHFNEPAPETIVPPEAPGVPMSKARPGRDSRAANDSKASPRAADKVVPVKATERASEARTQVRIRRVSLTQDND